MLGRAALGLSELHSQGGRKLKPTGFDVHRGGKWVTLLSKGTWPLWGYTYTLSQHVAQRLNEVV